MHRMIFVNLPVADLDASRRFFADIGYEFNEKFCDDNSLCIVLGETQFAMLLRTDFFDGFTTKDVADSKATAEVLIALSADTREYVDDIVDKAIAAGATPGKTEDHGFMYGRAYNDLDGHVWEIIWMDPQAAQDGPPQG